MTRPPRLLESSSNDALRSLLSSGLDDAPDANALPKVAATLGLAAVTVTASSLAAVSVAAQAKAAALAGSAPATLAGSTAVSASTALSAGTAASAGATGFWGGSTALALGKTLLVSMVSAGALSVGAVAVYESTNPTGTSAVLSERTSGTEQRVPHARAQAAPTAGTPAVSEPGAAISKDATASAAPIAPSNLRADRAQAPPAPADAEPQRAGVLAREVRQIDSARQALESRDADGALAELDSYERSRVVGVLDREALLLKIEALSQKQDLAQAKALTRQYLERFPRDAHAPRLRALLGASQGVTTSSSSVQAFPDE